MDEALSQLKIVFPIGADDTTKADIVFVAGVSGRSTFHADMQKSIMRSVVKQFKPTDDIRVGWVFNRAADAIVGLQLDDYKNKAQLRDIVDDVKVTV